MGKKSVSIQVRERIVGLSLDPSNSNRDIGDLVGVSEKCVRTTLKNHKKIGSARESPRSGRPPALSPSDENWIYRQVRRDPKISIRNLTTEFNSSYPDNRVSHGTVAKALKKKQIGSYSAIRKPLLSVMDRLKRKKWCKDRLYWTIDDWSKVIFSDESNFEVINRKSRVIVKRHSFEKYHTRFCVPRVQGGGGSAGIWGCISWHGTGCSRVYTGRINQSNYKDILENELLPSADLFYSEGVPWKFMQDGAPAHTANSIKDWIASQQIDLLDWCPRSPDLNPIENIWSWMDARLAKENLRTVDELKEALEALWLDVPSELVKKLIESMPKRVKACYNAKGGHFKY
jgi:transposase